MAQTETRFIQQPADKINPVNPNTPGLILLQALAGGAAGYAEGRQQKAERQATAQSQELQFLSTLANKGQIGTVPSYGGQKPVYSIRGNDFFAKNSQTTATKAQAQARIASGVGTKEDYELLSKEAELDAKLDEARLKNTPPTEEELDSMAAFFETGVKGSIEFEYGGKKYRLQTPDDPLGQLTSRGFNREAATKAFSRKSSSGTSGDIQVRSPEFSQFIADRKSQGLTTNPGDIQALSIAQKLYNDGADPNEIVDQLRQYASDAAVKEFLDWAGTAKSKSNIFSGKVSNPRGTGRRNPFVSGVDVGRGKIITSDPHARRKANQSTVTGYKK